MKTCGKLHDIRNKIDFQWKIEDFFTLATEIEAGFSSPLFAFAGESWYLGLYPNGDVSDGQISLFLYRNKSGDPVSLKCSFELKPEDGKECYKKQFTYEYKKGEGYGFGFPQFLSRDILSEKKLELVPSDTLTVVCSIENYLKEHDDDKKTANCSHCKNSFDVISVSSLEQKFSDTFSICPTCAKDVGQPRICYSHECKKNRVKATEKLMGDLQNIIYNKEHSDVIIKVKDEEFHLHRCILAARNSYFNSMFKTEMNETTTGIVTIEDCESDIFRSFIHFVYTGKVDDLSLENVRDLYQMADKYQEEQLKEECLCFMNSKLSVENFCDFIVFALKYDEKELLQNATELFCRKTREIIKSDKWQTFMREYPNESNELHIKALDYVAK